MLRLTTNVTVSPASSARSSSAAWRMSSIASGRLSANIAVELVRRRAPAPSRARSIVPGADGRRAAARDEGAVAVADHLEHARRDPLGVDERGRRRTGARRARRRPRRAACAPGPATGTGARARCGRRWPTGRRGRSRRRPTSSGHQSARFGGTWMPTSGISRRVSAISRFRSSMPDRRRPLRRAVHRPVVQAGAPERVRRLGGDVGRLLAVVAPVRHEVLQDHLLQVVEARQRLERRHAVLLGLADADQDPAGEGDPQLLRRRAMVASRSAGCLVGDPWWATRSGLTDSSINP